MLSANNLIVKCEDHRFASDEAKTNFDHHLFIRLSAKQRVFEDVSFKYCVFDGCYLRACKFLRCDFTGCRFLSTNFHSSLFVSCNFAYAVFEKTMIADDILDTQAPEYENLREKFARSLRINYQQLGEANSVNKAIKIELEATKTHLYRCWNSKKDYYTEKNGGIRRLPAFFRWAWFMLLHLVWGNGESALRLLISLMILFVAMGIYHAEHAADPNRIQSYWDGIRIAPEVFLGVRSFPQYADWYLTVVGSLRLLSFAALTSILLKRFSRR